MRTSTAWVAWLATGGSSANATLSRASMLLPTAPTLRKPAMARSSKTRVTEASPVRRPAAHGDGKGIRRDNLVTMAEVRSEG